MMRRVSDNFLKTVIQIRIKTQLRLSERIVTFKKIFQRKLKYTIFIKSLILAQDERWRRA